MTNTSNLHGFSILWFSTILTLFPILTTSFDTITATQPLSLGQTIVSSGNVFELGFFSPNNSTNYWYVGIWYKNVPTTFVWVANRDNPLTNSSSAFLKIGQDGNIILIDHSSNPPIWSSNQTTSNTTVAQLLDSGNFVVQRENDVNPDNYLWQSFDYPTDTLLPGMKLGWDAKTGLNRYLTPWKTTDDPSSGDYEFKLDINGFPEAFLTNKQVRKYRSGPWNGLRFSGVPKMNMTSNIILFTFVMKPDEISYSFELENKSVYSRLLVNPSGVLQRYTWIETSQLWNLYWYAPKDQCDSYMECGVYGVCNTNDSPVCNCMTGFEPKNLQAWNLRDGSDGCVRIGELNCENDGFLTLKDMKLPETSSAFMNQSMSLSDCEMACKRNCSCTAYANMDIVGGGSGCVIWTGDLLDMRQYASAEGGQATYMRVSASDLGKGKHREKLNIGFIVASSMVFSGAIICGLCWWKAKQRGKREKKLESFGLVNTLNTSMDTTLNPVRQHDALDLPMLDFNKIVAATNNFSINNKLGEGGFGPVFKGNLQDGQEIAVKRLSRCSEQGIDEFKNEIILISRLQHKNLVTLLGCCIEGAEKLIVYEYMYNKSLDTFLFDATKRGHLDWTKRFNIIQGITRGLLYLHRDSRLKIIHRDLKVSNILLDKDMNPKISDFGLARTFRGTQQLANTHRPAGTIGYMSPEYALRGIFSEKSDVFSFGVLLLEIICGRKNTSFHDEQYTSLLGYVWHLWNEGRALDFMDQALVDSCCLPEVMTCIHIALLCVQDNAADRPTMSSIARMLTSEIDGPQPKQPTFTLGSDLQSQNKNICSINEVTVSMLEGR